MHFWAKPNIFKLNVEDSLKSEKVTLCLKMWNQAKFEAYENFI
jgi:hypothetical protein